ncbi:MAG: hypothetical protein EH225_11670 [Calditrichaeota bacterium]|nr:MAG: hypothetical protein EH225_11670 [Calditrichota bacterium]
MRAAFFRAHAGSPAFPEKPRGDCKEKSFPVLPEIFFNRDHHRDGKRKITDRFCRKNRRPFFVKKSRSDDEKLTTSARTARHHPRQQQHPRVAFSIAIRFF